MKLSLRSRIVLMLFGIFGVYLVVDYMVQSTIVYPSFVALERAEAYSDMQHVRDMIRREAQNLSMLTSDLAADDNTYDFTLTRHAQQLDGALRQEAVTLNFDLVSIFATDGELIWGRIKDPRSGVRRETDDSLAPDVATASLPADHTLLSAGRFNSSVEGLLNTPQGPLTIAARPILRTNGEGPVAGILVLGRFLREDRIHLISNHLRGNLRFTPIAPNGAGQQQNALDMLHLGRPIALTEESAEKLVAYTALNDIFGNQAVLVRAEIPRLISVNGTVAVRVAVFSVVAAGVTVLLLIWVILQHQVINPIQRLTRHAVHVGHSDDLSARLNMQRHDEIGALAGALDQMVQRLADSRTRMLDAAHEAGMAEIATEVLHNVGNALNSVNVSSEILEETIRDSKITGLSRAAALLNENREHLAEFLNTDPRGRLMLDYLSQLASTLANEQAQMREESSALRERVQHIKSIIDTQQSYAGSLQYIQEEDLAEVMDDALRVSNQSSSKHDNIIVRRNYGTAPPVPINKSKLMQVLVNLIRNAQDAMRNATPDSIAQLTLTVSPAGDDEVMLEVRDTGEGIDAENLDRIFQYGFSTKRQGRGFGLHFCATAIAEMGGRITARSDGPGQGTVFSIVLPVRQPQVVKTPAHA